LKRVYPDDIQSIINKLSTKSLRNWWNKILDYDLESDSDKDVERTIQKSIQKVKDEPKKKNNKKKATQQIVIDDKAEENIRAIKEHFSNEKPHHKSINENIKPSKPVEQPTIVYENNSAISNKPQIAPTKTKPFKIKETPKKINDSQGIETHLTAKKDSPRSKKTVSAQVEEFINDNDNNGKVSNKFLVGKHENREIKSLSNTQCFDRNSDNIDTTGNQLIRKSMNNLKVVESNSSKSSNDDRYSKNETKQSIKQPIKPFLNNSSSQSSLPQMTGIMDLGNKKRIDNNANKFPNEVIKQHETINEQHHVFRPLAQKVSNSEETSPEFGKPLELSNKIRSNIAHSANQSIDSDKQSSESEEEKLPVKQRETIKVEKQQSSSSEEEVDAEEENNEAESDEEEFPVALNRLVFSFLPQEVADNLNDMKDWKNRTFAIQEMETLIKKQFAKPNEDFPIYITDIWKKMCKMMHDSNFKISLTSLRIIHNLWIKYPNEILTWLTNLVNNLSEKLSDNKIVIRHAVLKVFYALITTLGAKKILNHIVQYL